MRSNSLRDKISEVNAVERKGREEGIKEEKIYLDDVVVYNDKKPCLKQLIDFIVKVYLFI